MKDEIKEILEITETADYKRLSVDEIIIIKDYIINLQKENRQTKLLKELYKLRNEKATELVKQNLMGIGYVEVSNLLDILQGSDEE